MSRIEAMVADLNRLRERRDELLRAQLDLSDRDWDDKVGDYVRKPRRWYQIILRGKKMSVAAGGPEVRIDGQAAREFYTFFVGQIAEAEKAVREAEAALSELEPR